MSELALQLIEKEKRERKGRLDLGRSGLNDFWPEELFELVWLEELVMCNRWWDWEQQKWIESPNSGRKNYFSSLPAAIAQLKQLKKLKIGDDSQPAWPIKDLQALEKLTQLQSLDLSYNQISDIRFLEKLTQLQSLYLSYNQITDIRFLEKLTQLQSLYLSYNQITDIRFLEKLTQLQSLDLSYNQITDIRFLEKLTQLQSLDLRVNQITDVSPLVPLISRPIPITIKEYESGINLYKNPLKIPPPEIVQQGNQAVLNFFKQLKFEGEDYLFEAKLLILGESGAGKTSFARKIQKSEAILPEEEETTRGIEVEPWRFELSQSEVLASAKGNQFTNAVALEKALQNGFRANLWDFGGQEIYHSTHRFFLSHRSLYILLANARNQDTDFNYWLNIAEQLGGDSPLLVVINEKQGHRWRIDETGLRGRFGFFKELFEVNFGDDSDLGRLERLRNCIKRYLGELPHIGDTLPKSWAAIRRALQEENKPFISFERYQNICGAHGMMKLDRVLQLSQYLHDIGVFLHFQHEPVLKNRIFLDANWTTTTVYRLLNDAEVKNNKGRFTLADAKRIWPEAEVQLVHDELLKLLERFNLSYRIEHTNQFITPEHLPEPKPYSEWEHQNELLMLRYEFDAFMPKGLITELIVALHRYIPDQERVWRKGVVLKRENAWAEIIEAYGNVFRIEIKVAGRDKKELLTVIAEALDRILARFAKLHFEKLVPCNCERCSQTNDKSFYKLSDLKRRLGNRKDTIDCPKNDDKATPIPPMLEETMNFEKDLSIAKVIAKGEIQEAIAILEGRSSGAFKDEATHFRFQLSDLEAEYGKGKIDFDTYRQTRAKVADAILKLDQKMD